MNKLLKTLLLILIVFFQMEINGQNNDDVKGNLDLTGKVVDINSKVLKSNIYVLLREDTIIQLLEQDSFKITLEIGSQYIVFFSKKGFETKSVFIDMKYYGENEYGYEIPLEIKLKQGKKDVNNVLPAGSIFYNEETDFYEIGPYPIPEVKKVNLEEHNKIVLVFPDECVMDEDLKSRVTNYSKTQQDRFETFCKNNKLTCKKEEYQYQYEMIMDLSELLPFVLNSISPNLEIIPRQTDVKSVDEYKLVMEQNNADYVLFFNDISLTKLNKKYLLRSKIGIYSKKLNKVEIIESNVDDSNPTDMFACTELLECVLNNTELEALKLITEVLVKDNK